MAGHEGSPRTARHALPAAPASHACVGSKPRPRAAGILFLLRPFMAVSEDSPTHCPLLTARSPGQPRLRGKQASPSRRRPFLFLCRPFMAVREASPRTARCSLPSPRPSTP
ncbi:MAG: hypothetical protein K2F91_02540, partial [Muribaculaceae bacterium]|nr:hypothetical protein [Muribaculaceae bacterium]